MIVFPIIESQHKEPGDSIEESLTVGELIKRFVKLRGRTMREVASYSGRNYTTLSDVINRNSRDAELLFELVNLLDIDFSWTS